MDCNSQTFLQDSELTSWNGLGNKSTLTGRNEKHEDIRGHEGMIKVKRKKKRCRDKEMETHRDTS